ncbi:MAG: Asp-tRNA(Asn)/Glu-tRNA(Gln) amidotransferase GatCAB subunit A, partial [Armatimonadota bacterium]
MGILSLSAAEIARGVRAREFSCVEVVQAFLDATSERDGDLHAFLRLDPEVTLNEAAAAQIRVDAGEGGVLAGVPVATKDNLSTEGIETTCASRILEGYIPPFDATVVTRVRAAGGVVFGKTNLDEFAMGTSCENSAFGTTRNPWDLARTPGGSSGGSVAAVAGGMA